MLNPQFLAGIDTSVRAQALHLEADKLNCCALYDIAHGLHDDRPIYRLFEHEAALGLIALEAVLPVVMPAR